MVFILRRQKRRIVAISGVTVQNPVGIKARRPNPDTAFKVILGTDSNRRNVPILVVRIGIGRAMPCSSCKSAGLVRKRVVRLVFKRPKRTVAYVNPIGITAELGSGRAILQVIFVVVFGHERAFGKRLQKRIVVIFAETFPAMLVVVERQNRNALAFGLERLAIQFHSVQRIQIARTVIFVDFILFFIPENLRIPGGRF